MTAAGSGRGVARRRGGRLVGVVALSAGLVGLAGCAAPPGPADGAAGQHAETAVQSATLARCPAPANPATGQPELPDLTLPCLGAGDPVPMRRLAGTPTVLNLWASYCAPCRAELPAFQRLSAAAGGRVRVLGVVTEDPPSRALSLAADVDVHFPSVVDDTGKLMRGLGRSALPATVLVAADGRVARVYSGPQLGYDDLRRMVRDDLGVAVA